MPIVFNSHPIAISEIVRSGNLDAFNRIRTSEPFAVFSSKQSYDSLPLLWDDQQVSGSGTTSTFNANTASTTISVSASTAGSRIRQTFRKFNYQPGKSQLIQITRVLGNPTTGITRESGLFDDNNGVFFRSGPIDISVVIRTKTTGVVTETSINQSNWNIDKMNGTGPSGIILDLSKAQIFVIDFEWLGVGAVRFGFNINGNTYYCHQYNTANIGSVVWASTPNLPIRDRISNDGTGLVSSISCICSSVISEGGVEDLGFPRGFTRASSLTTNNDSNIYSLIGFRLKSNANNITSILRNFSVVCTSTATFAVYLILSPTIAGTAPTWSGITNSAVEIASTTTNSNTVTNGTIVYSSVTQSVSESSLALQGPSGLYIGSNISGISQELWLCVQRLTGTSETFYGAINWGEM